MIEDPMLSMKDCREVPEIAEMPSEKREGLCGALEVT